LAQHRGPRAAAYSSEGKPVSHFTIEASYGHRDIKAAVMSNRVDRLIDDWADAAAKVGSTNRRGDTRQLVVNALQSNQHHEDVGVGELVVQALVWLAATGAAGERLLPRMRAGGCALGYEISDLDERSCRFRLRVDEATMASMRC
jgi:hypothetical protein